MNQAFVSVISNFGRAVSEPLKIAIIHNDNAEPRIQLQIETRNETVEMAIEDNGSRISGNGVNGCDRRSNDGFVKSREWVWPLVLQMDCS